MSKNPRPKLQDAKNQSFTGMPILAHSKGVARIKVADTSMLDSSDLTI